MAAKLHIAIAEHSAIVRRGLMSIIQTLDSDVMFTQITDFETLLDELALLDLDLLIVNPSNVSQKAFDQFREFQLKVIAIQTTLADKSVFSNYDGVISVFDSESKIHELVLQMINNKEEVQVKAELSQREKEIVICVTKGLTNKEIADELFLSTHTVIAHRRNISSKLSIHSTSGLTIYAILHKLIDIDSLPIK